MSLVLENVSFTFPHGSKVLASVNLEVPRGSFTGLIGPNGAGKSTLLNIASGVLSPAKGRVLLEDRSLIRYGRRELARRMAVVPQRSDLPDAFSARSVVAMGRAPHLGFFAHERSEDAQVIEQAMRRTDAWRFRDQHVGSLSGGERQRVVLARALAQRPEWLLLDEPTAHLDLRYQADVLRYARRLAHEDGLGVLAVLHDLNHAAHCDALIVLHEGSVVAHGSVDEILTEPLLSRVYQTQVLVRAGDPPTVTTPAGSSA